MNRFLLLIPLFIFPSLVSPSKNNNIVETIPSVVDEELLLDSGYTYNLLNELKENKVKLDSLKKLKNK